MDAGPFGFERASTGIVLVRRVAEQGKVGGVGPGAYPGRDGVHDPAYALSGDPVENRGLCGGERGQPVQRFAGAVGDPVQYQEENLLSNHREQMRSRT